MSNFVSVATSAARYQDISLNPQKLAGQCAKLKCCLNFEVDTYVEASKQLPPRDVRLETKDSVYYHFKTDIFKREITYSTDKSVPANLVTLPAERVFEVIALNKNGIKPEKLAPDSKQRQEEIKEFGDIIGQDSVTRFDKKKKKSRGSGNQRNRQGNNGNGEQRGNENRQGNNRNGAGQKRQRGDGGNRQSRQGGGERRSPRRNDSANDVNGNNENKEKNSEPKAPVE